MKESKEVKVWKCGYCGKLHWDKVSADVCHQDRTCKTCGKVIGKNSYHTQCDDCIKKAKFEKQKELFEKAEKLTIKEYIEKYPKHMVCYGYRYLDVDEIDWYFDDLKDEDSEFFKPDYVWGTKAITCSLDSDSIIERFEGDTELEEYYMDKEMSKEIHEFCKKWNKKHEFPVYNQTTSIAVLLK